MYNIGIMNKQHKVIDTVLILGQAAIVWAIIIGVIWGIIALIALVIF